MPEEIFDFQIEKHFKVNIVQLKHHKLAVVCPRWWSIASFEAVIPKIVFADRNCIVRVSLSLFDCFERCLRHFNLVFSQSRKLNRLELMLLSSIENSLLKRLGQWKRSTSECHHEPQSSITSFSSSFSYSLHVHGFLNCQREKVAETFFRREFH